MLRLSSATLILGTCLAAQVPVALQNLANRPRGGWVSFTVPEASVKDPVIEMAPQGWPAYWGHRVGTKARLVHIRCGEIAPLAQVSGQLRAAKPSSSGGGHGGGPSAHGRFEMPEVVIGTHRWRATSLQLVEGGPARSVYYAFGRPKGSKFVVHMWYYVYAASRVVPFELMIAHCDQTSKETVARVSTIELSTIPELHPSVDFLVARGGSAPKRVGDKVVTRLHDATWFKHGQGGAWSGRFLLWEGASGDSLRDLLAANEAPIVGMAMNWQGQWGPWGAVPEPHPKADSADMLRVRREHVQQLAADMRTPGNLWRRWRFGLEARPAGPGAQNDFGASKFGPLFYWKGGNPFHLWQVLPSVLRDAGRDSYFYENDGSPLDLAKHPRWATWGYRTHYHPSKSPDQLGKGGWDTTTPNVLWYKDFGHASSNNLAGWTKLTGSWLGKHLCQQEITCIVRFDRSFGLGEERSWGRVPLSASWNYVATGDRRVMTAFNDIANHGRFKVLFDAIERKDEVKLFAHSRPDNRYFNGKYPFWTPWHQGLAITGLDAMSQQMSPKNARLETALLELCRTHVTHGWAKLNGRWRVGAAVRWLDGKGLLPAQKYDREYFIPGDGTNFRQWCWPAVRIAMRRLVREPALLARAKEINDTLRREWEASAPKRPIGELSRPSEWAAVR